MCNHPQLNWLVQLNLHIFTEEILTQIINVTIQICLIEHLNTKKIFLIFTEKKRVIPKVISKLE